MACELWRDKLDAYADGELAVADAAALGAHLRGCASCSADVLERVQLKRSIAAAGKNYAASAQLREKVRRSVAVSPPRERWRWWNLVAAPAALAPAALARAGAQARRVRQPAVLACRPGLAVPAPLAWWRSTRRPLA